MLNEKATNIDAVVTAVTQAVVGIALFSLDSEIRRLVERPVGVGICDRTPMVKEKKRSRRFPQA